MTPEEQAELQKLKVELYRQTGLFQLSLLLLLGWLATLQMVLQSVNEMLLEHPRVYPLVDKMCISLYALLGLVLIYYYGEFCFKVYHQYKVAIDNWRQGRRKIK